VRQPRARSPHHAALSAISPAARAAEGEVKSRTITPKVKDILQKELRQTGLPGFGLFGAPSDDRVDDAKRGVGTKGNKNDAWKPKGLEKYKKPQN